jgi:DNA excision repair protein ERCC-4
MEAEDHSEQAIVPAGISGAAAGQQGQGLQAAGAAAAAAGAGQRQHEGEPDAEAADGGELLAEALRQAAAGMLLPFQRALVEELLEEDGLCVLSPGLGLIQAVAVLLRLQDARLRQPGQGGVVLVLGASPWQREALRRELLRIDPEIRHRAEAAAAAGAAAPAARATGGHLGSTAAVLAGGFWEMDVARSVASLETPPHVPHPSAAHQTFANHPAPPCPPAASFEVPAEVSTDVAQGERQALYASRSCLFVTTRILVVDQLSSRIKGEQIAGMIVLNAHRWVGAWVRACVRGWVGGCWGGRTGGMHARTVQTRLPAKRVGCCCAAAWPAAAC